MITFLVLLILNFVGEYEILFFFTHFYNPTYWNLTNLFLPMAFTSNNLS